MYVFSQTSAGFKQNIRGGGGGWNSGLPYLVANTFGLNFIKIRGISIFRGTEAPYKRKEAKTGCDLHEVVSNT